MFTLVEEQTVYETEFDSEFKDKYYGDQFDGTVENVEDEQVFTHN